MTDSELLLKISANNQSAIADYYDSVYPRFVSYFRKNYNKSDEYSMDLFHDSFMAMYDNILNHKLTPDNLTTSLYQYMLGIAIHTMQAKDRKEHAFDQISFYHSSSADTEEEVLDPAVQRTLVNEADAEASEQEREDLREYVDKAVAELKPPCNELLYNFYWLRMSGEEIAAAMNYSNPDSVKTQKNKCMKKIKSFVQEYLLH